MSGGGGPELPEALVKMVQAFADDEDLREWFYSFDNTPETARSAEFQRMADRMENGGEHPEVVQATRLLADVRIYAAARGALAELLG